MHYKRRSVKVLYITPGYYPRIGGVEYVVKSVAERLVARGHDVTVVAGEPGLCSLQEGELNGVEVIRWPTYSPGNAYHFPIVRSKLRELLLEKLKRCDVVHLHSVHSVFTIYALTIVKDCYVHTVLTPHYHGCL
ncbi:MAG: glycosyltransferase, partial [Candidatus Nezhaarchaeota archaeon]|nr:glycosyltransferase [Candidatus Nezhaarchaeota archaeon]